MVSHLTANQRWRRVIKKDVLISNIALGTGFKRVIRGKKWRTVGTFVEFEIPPYTQHAKRELVHN